MTPMRARKHDPGPPASPSGLSDCIAMQLAEAVEAFVAGSVHPIADAIGALFREQVKRLLIPERPARSASALALWVERSAPLQAPDERSSPKLELRWRISVCLPKHLGSNASFFNSSMTA
jgi:hypothetical protein